MSFYLYLFFWWVETISNVSTTTSPILVAIVQLLIILINIEVMPWEVKIKGLRFFTRNCGVSKACCRKGVTFLWEKHTILELFTASSWRSFVMFRFQLLFDRLCLSAFRYPVYQSLSPMFEQSKLIFIWIIGPAMFCFIGFLHSMLHNMTTTQ